jgi:hypothetical protein
LPSVLLKHRPGVARIDEDNRRTIRSRSMPTSPWSPILDEVARPVRNALCATAKRNDANATSRRCRGLQGRLRLQRGGMHGSRRDPALCHLQLVHDSPSDSSPPFCAAGPEGAKVIGPRPLRPLFQRRGARPQRPLLRRPGGRPRRPLLQRRGAPAYFSVAQAHRVAVDATTIAGRESGDTRRSDDSSGETAGDT